MTEKLRDFGEFFLKRGALIMSSFPLVIVTCCFLSVALTSPIFIVFSGTSCKFDHCQKRPFFPSFCRLLILSLLADSYKRSNFFLVYFFIDNLAISDITTVIGETIVSVFILLRLRSCFPFSKNPSSNPRCDIAYGGTMYVCTR